MKTISRKAATKKVNNPKWKHSLACNLTSFQCWCFDIPLDITYGGQPPYLKLRKELKPEVS